MYIALLIILIAYQAIQSILDKRDMQKYRGLAITESDRIKFYKEAIVFGWVPVWIILLFVGISSLTLSDIGLRAISLSNSTWLNRVIGIISGAILSALGYQTIMYFISAKYRSAVMAEMSRKKDGNSPYDTVAYQILIPKSSVEKRWFLFVSLTAGICEELVWRGCLIFLLSNIFSVHIIVVYMVSCILFGLAHCYQGVYGVIKTSIIAILFIMIYIVTDSIIPGIILHFLFDYSSAFLIKDAKLNEVRQ